MAEDEYSRYERRRKSRRGHYGHDPEDYPRRMQGSAYAGHDDLGFQFTGPAAARGGYYAEEPLEDLDSAEPYDPRPRQNVDWRVPGPYTGMGPKRLLPSDDEIFRTVRERLKRQDYLDVDDIQVSVQDGEVTLEGIVQDRFAKRTARDVADFVPGVRDVHNHLTIRRED